MQPTPAPESLPTPRAFRRMLRAHDWYAMYSDDYRVTMRAERERNALYKLALRSDALMLVWRNFIRHEFGS